MSQPMPRGRGEPVIVALCQCLPGWLAERLRVGVANYGEPLRPFNGRNPVKDLRDELLDGLNYAVQVEQEMATLIVWAREAQLLLRTWESEACQEHAAELDGIVTYTIE
jgi:hypothetical protein